MTLHEFLSESNPAANECQSQAPESLQSSLDQVSFISKRFNEKSCQVDIEAIFPFPPYGIYKAASVQNHLWKKTGDVSHQDAANSLSLMVRRFSKRWKKAGKFTRAFAEWC